MLCLKREMPDFLEEVEKEEKKCEIAIRKEMELMRSGVVAKTRQEVEQTKNMIKGGSQEDMLDKIHGKVKGIE